MSNSRRTDSTGANASRVPQLVAEMSPQPQLISAERFFFEDALEKTGDEALHDWEDEGGALNNSGEESNSPMAIKLKKQNYYSE